MENLNFVQNITIGGQPFSVIESTVVLTLNRFGRARFLVQSETEPVGLVKFTSGYQGKNITQWITAFIESAVEVKKGQWRIFCRELSAIYYTKCPIALRNVNLAQVTEALFNLKGLAFSVPDKPYAKEKVAAFNSWGRGLDAIEQLGRVFSIPDYVWYLLDDNSIFIGSHQDSIFAGRDLPIDKSAFIDLTNTDATISLIPGLRPGYSVNDKRIQQITITDNKMVLEWY